MRYTTQDFVRSGNFSFTLVSWFRRVVLDRKNRPDAKLPADSPDVLTETCHIGNYHHRLLLSAVLLLSLLTVPILTCVGALTLPVWYGERWVTITPKHLTQELLLLYQLATLCGYEKTAISVFSSVGVGLHFSAFILHVMKTLYMLVHHLGP